MTTPAPPNCAGYRCPAKIINFAVWLYVRFPLSLRHVDEILAARGIVVSHASQPGLEEPLRPRPIKLTVPIRRQQRTLP